MRHLTLMSFVRIWLPILIGTAGLVILAIRRDETGAEAAVVLIAAGASVWFMNVLFRMGVAGERDRDAEDEARAYFDRHGRWPDETPPPPTG